MRPGSHPALVIVLALALSGLAVPTLAAGGATSSGLGPPAAQNRAQVPGQVQTQEAPENSPTTRFVINLQTDGDARWRVETGFDLDGENDTAAFRRLADRFEAGTHDTGYSAAPFRRAAAAASDASGRQMSIVSVNRSSDVVNGTNGTGYLVIRFTWTNFSRTSGDRLYVDEAFDTPTGTWLPRLGPDQTLLIRPPSGYAVLSAPKGPVNGTLRWTGPVSFSQDTLDITYERGTLPTPRQPIFEELDPATLALVGLLVFALGVAALWVRQSGYPFGESVPLVGETSGESNPGTATEADVGAEAHDGSRPGVEAEAEAATNGSESTTADSGVVAEPPEEELLSDEERVERLLEHSGGRMKQATIVEETGWSNAKVSQLLSSMEEDDRIEKLRIGRENLISLPGEMGNNEV